MNIHNLVSFAGIFILIGVAWVFSENRRIFNWKVVVWGTILQLVFGAFVFLVPFGARIFLVASDLVVKLLEASTAGAVFCFGPLAAPPGSSGSVGFILVTKALPTIIFFATLMQILYYVRIMPLLIKGCAAIFTRLMNVSGAEALCTASNIFVGIESATTILPHIARMTRSELGTILTAGMATIASSVLGLYVMLLKPQFSDIAGHLISASILSAPAALVMAKVLMPESGKPETLGVNVEPYYERESSVIEAAINGATAGGKLMLGVVVMLIAFLGLVALLNITLRSAGCPPLENLLAYIFYPFALVIGVSPADAWEVARLLGMRVIMTEVPAYEGLARLIATHGLHDGRSAVLASYALCGFAHVASVAIFVGGTAALAPARTPDLARVAIRALVAATLACLMTAAVAGTFYGRGTLVLNLT